MHPRRLVAPRGFPAQIPQLALERLSRLSLALQPLPLLELEAHPFLLPPQRIRRRRRGPLRLLPPRVVVVRIKATGAAAARNRCTRGLRMTARLPAAPLLLRVWAGKRGPRRRLRRLLLLRVSVVSTYSEHRSRRLGCPRPHRLTRRVPPRLGRLQELERLFAPRAGANVVAPRCASIRVVPRQRLLERHLNLADVPILVRVWE